MKACIGLIAVVLAAQSASGSLYWYSWSAADGILPENNGDGWERSWGNSQGPLHGAGAVRTFHDGILTYDSLYDFDRAIETVKRLDPDPQNQALIEREVLRLQKMRKKTDSGPLLTWRTHR